MFVHTNANYRRPFGGRYGSVLRASVCAGTAGSEEIDLSRLSSLAAATTLGALIFVGIWVNLDLVYGISRFHTWWITALSTLITFGYGAWLTSPTRIPPVGSVNVNERVSTETGLFASVRNRHTLRQLKAITAGVNSIESIYAKLSDAELRMLTDQFRTRLGTGATVDDLLPEAFATVREAAFRVLGERHFDVQIMGAAAMHFGNIAEMRTGEGKTLVSTLPAYLNALPGKGVHIVTVNDYLAERDAEWVGQIHRFLGLTVGLVLPNRPSAEHKAAYECDITYGTSSEFGFDYLRDNMAWTMEDLVQRGHHYAIADEVDLLLLDEARTPLVISGPAEVSPRWYSEFARIASRLECGKDGSGDYEVDEVRRGLTFTERGISRVEDRLGIENLYESVNTPLVGFLNNAVKAKELYKRDKDYIINDGRVMIVDDLTGRLLVGRRYNEGLHQAIEAKEGVDIGQESQSLATVTVQNYFRLYDKLCGMTSTAQTEAEEFRKVYKMGVVTLPTHHPMIRLDQVDAIYKTEKAKFQRVVADVARRHGDGQPVLVGTVSVEHSEALSLLLTQRGIPHAVLNAKHHAREAEIIAQAGRKAAVTVATNMAGRGIDILLGGNPQFLAAAEMRSREIDPQENPDVRAEALERWAQVCGEEAKEVAVAGGLYVLGTERHESRRIDNQLRGRAGRQGDPGESRFYLSLQDDLMRRFRAAAVEAVMDRLNIPDDVAIESIMVSSQIRSAQAQIEAQNVATRTNVLKYDDVLDKQRKIVYAERQRVLSNEDLHSAVELMTDDVIEAYVDGSASVGRRPHIAERDLDQLWINLKQLYPVGLSIDDMKHLAEDGKGRFAIDVVKDALKSDVRIAYRMRAESLPHQEAMKILERQVLLHVIDRKWREHLSEMDYLQEGVALRAYAHRDPLGEYRREGFDMFLQMVDALKEEAVGYLFNAAVQITEAEPNSD